jgi:hypothetical protein
MRRLALQQASYTGLNSFSPSMSIALPATVWRIQGQSGVPNRAARSGQVSGRKCE